MGKLHPDLIMNSHWWPHKRLPEGLQHGIAEAIIHTCESEMCKPIAKETKQDVALYVFAQLSQIPPNILEQLEKFDYSQDVPKIVIFNNEKSGELTRSDAVLLLFLNQIGVDVFHFNPTGRNDIEPYIEAGHLIPIGLKRLISILSFMVHQLIKFITNNKRTISSIL